MSAAADDPCLHWLQRSYCYLRLSGADTASACRELRQLMDELADAGDDPAAREQARERLWHQLSHKVDQATAIDPAAPLPLRRGHLHYDHEGD